MGLCVCVWVCVCEAYFCCKGQSFSFISCLTFPNEVINNILFLFKFLFAASSQINVYSRCLNDEGNDATKTLQEAQLSECKCLLMDADIIIKCLDEIKIRGGRSGLSYSGTQQCVTTGIEVSISNIFYKNLLSVFE